MHILFSVDRPTTLIPVSAGLGAVPRHPNLVERESMWGDVSSERLSQPCEDTLDLFGGG